VEHPRFRSGSSGAWEPVFFDIEKQHGIGDDCGGILLAAEIKLALDALPGGGIKGEIFRKGIVSQRAVLSSLWFSHSLGATGLGGTMSHVLIGCELRG
jgi:hypothetical protein